MANVASPGDMFPDAAAREATIARICEFLVSIGIAVREGEVAAQTFLPGIELVDGGIVFERAKMLYPGDLLHEAGHIAVCEGALRPTLNGNALGDSKERLGEEIVAQLWSYAASLEAGVAPEIVFHEHGYKGAHGWILGNFQNGAYTGLPLLVWMGLAKPAGEPDGFPSMVKWLRG